MLKPFDFQYKLRDHFRKQEKTWKWFSEVKVKEEQTEQFKNELLKNTYRLDPSSETTIYKLLDEAKNKLGVIVPVTIYQSQYSQDSNAGIIFIQNEAHLVLSGPILKSLSEQELLALISHELSHVLLYTIDNGDFEVTSRIINAIGNDYRSEDAFNETARLFSLFTELYCDIGAYKVCGSADTVISTLVKVETGLEKISAENYIKQADEVLAKMEKGSGGESHPESFIRAKSIDLYSKKETEAYKEISDIILGKLNLFHLNIFSKEEVHEITRELIQLVMKPKWMQSEHHKAHYQQYFKEYKVNSTIMITPEFKEKINKGSASMKDYYSYVMLDFALCDHDISEPASGHILDLAEQMEMSESLAKIFKKELNLSDKKFNEFAKNAATALNAILESEQEKTY
ncbi:MAG: peptidase family [Bacteroidetes bacterium]|nr:peptidase family [Bacteroidota bacterium]